MWSLFLTTFNTISSQVFLQREPGSFNTSLSKMNYINPYSSPLLYFKITQNPQSFNLVEATSSSGFLLKYSPEWQRYTTQNSNPTSDILLARKFPSSKGEVIVKITTTVTNFIGLPKILPKNVKKIDISADFFSRVLAESGYKIHQMTEVMIHEKKGFKLVTETPKKLGATIVLLEGKNETMIVSTSTYPIDNSIISPELLEQVMTEINLIQNSFIIR